MSVIVCKVVEASTACVCAKASHGARLQSICSETKATRPCVKRRSHTDAKRRNAAYLLHACLRGAEASPKQQRTLLMRLRAMMLEN